MLTKPNFAANKGHMRISLEPFEIIDFNSSSDEDRRADELQEDPFDLEEELERAQLASTRNKASPNINSRSSRPKLIEGSRKFSPSPKDESVRPIFERKYSSSNAQMGCSPEKNQIRYPKNSPQLKTPPELADKSGFRLSGLRITNSAKSKKKPTSKQPLSALISPPIHLMQSPSIQATAFTPNLHVPNEYFPIMPPVTPTLPHSISESRITRRDADLECPICDQKGLRSVPELLQHMKRHK